MHFRVVRPAELTEQELSTWRSCLAGEVYDSPFFEPDFTRFLGEIREDLVVAVAYRDEEPVGFVPFHQNRHGVARPVGLRLSDYNGPILRAGQGLDPKLLLRGAGLRAWHFDHLPSGLSDFECWSLSKSPSPFIDLSQGYQAYRDSQKAAGHGTIGQIERKRRKLIREVGALRFEANSEQESVFEDMLRWKSRQRELTASFDVLGVSWVRGYLKRLWKQGSEHCSAPLACLYAGDELVAVHLGLQGKRTLHYWFPTYNPAFGAYSPGLIMVLELARQAAEQGLVRLDLGKGPGRYKSHLASGARSLSLGVVDSRRIHRAAFRLGYWTKSRLARTPLMGPLSASKRFLRRSSLARIMREA